MKKNSFLILLVVLACTYCTSLSAQTNYSTTSSESLQKLKTDAVNASNFTKAVEIKKEIDVREAEQKKINELQIELDKKVKAEDFAGAAAIKEQLKVLKANKDRKDELRKQIATAIANSDFENAAKYKSELNSLTTQANQPQQKQVVKTTEVSTTLAVEVCKRDGKYELTETGDVLIKGKKVANIKKSMKGNIFLETMPEFTVYDVNDKPYMKFEGKDGKMIFLDDNKSFLPRKCDASVNSVAEFIASDCMFTELGFNINYRDEYIKKNSGYNASAKKIEGASAERNKSAYIEYVESTIMQDGQPIGTYKLKRREGSELSVYQILNNNKAVVAFVTINEPDTYNMLKIEVEVVDNAGKEKLAKTFSEMKTGNGLKDLRIGLKWLVSNNYL